MSLIKNGTSAAILSMLVGATTPAEAHGNNDDIWKGFYAGGFVGGGHADARVSIPSDHDRGDPGCLAGLELGYNWRSDDWVWGIECDAAIPDMQPGAGGGQHDLTVNSMSSFRARAGIKMGPHLIFATGGAGILTGIHASSDESLPVKHYIKARPVAGLGVEHHLSDHMSIKVEGIGFFGCNKLHASSETDELRAVYTARFGINFHF